jgi:uncharacterized Tic20 family protein
MAFCSACQVEAASGKFCTTCGRQLVDNPTKSADQVSTPAAVGGNNNLAMWAHLAPLLAATVGSFLGLVALLWLPGLLIRNSAKTDFERRHATESLNFQLSLLVYVAGGFVVGIATIGIGFLLLAPAGACLIVAALVFMIMATIAGATGKEYRYPLTIRFVK